MTPDMPHDPHEELESRITALLLGELPPDEAAALRERIAADPELSRLHARLKLALDLVREAAPVADLTAADKPEPLTLAADKRQQLLERFKKPAPQPAKIVKVSFWRKQRRELVQLAALVVALFVLISSILRFNRTQYLSDMLEGVPMPTRMRLGFLLPSEMEAPTPAGSQPASSSSLPSGGSPEHNDYLYLAPSMALTNGSSTTVQLVEKSKEEHVVNQEFSVGFMDRLKSVVGFGESQRAEVSLGEAERQRSLQRESRARAVARANAEAAEARQAAAAKRLQEGGQITEFGVNAVAPVPDSAASQKAATNQSLNAGSITPLPPGVKLGPEHVVGFSSSYATVTNSLSFADGELIKSFAIPQAPSITTPTPTQTPSRSYRALAELPRAHTYPQDPDILIAKPSGEKVILMSDAGAERDEVAGRRSGGIALPGADKEADRQAVFDEKAQLAAGGTIAPSSGPVQAGQNGQPQAWFGSGTVGGMGGGGGASQPKPIAAMTATADDSLDASGAMFAQRMPAVGFDIDAEKDHASALGLERKERRLGRTDSQVNQGRVMDEALVTAGIRVQPIPAEPPMSVGRELDGRKSVDQLAAIKVPEPMSVEAKFADVTPRDAKGLGTLEKSISGGIQPSFAGAPSVANPNGTFTGLPAAAAVAPVATPPPPAPAKPVSQAARSKSQAEAPRPDSPAILNGSAAVSQTSRSREADAVTGLQQDRDSLPAEGKMDGYFNGVVAGNAVTPPANGPDVIAQGTFLAAERSADDFALITVHRTNGSSGNVIVNFATPTDPSAVALGTQFKNSGAMFGASPLNPQQVGSGVLTAPSSGEDKRLANGRLGTASPTTVDGGGRFGRPTGSAASAGTLYFDSGVAGANRNFGNPSVGSDPQWLGVLETPNRSGANKDFDGDGLAGKTWAFNPGAKASQDQSKANDFAGRYGFVDGHPTADIGGPMQLGEAFRWGTFDPSTSPPQVLPGLRQKLAEVEELTKSVQTGGQQQSSGQSRMRRNAEVALLSDLEAKKENLERGAAAAGKELAKAMDEPEVALKQIQDLQRVETKRKALANNRSLSEEKPLAERLEMESRDGELSKKRAPATRGLGTTVALPDVSYEVVVGDKVDLYAKVPAPSAKPGSSHSDLAAAAKMDAWRRASEELKSPETAQAAGRAQESRLSELAEKKASTQRELEYSTAKLDAVSKKSGLDSKVAAQQTNEKKVWEARIKAAKAELARIDAEQAATKAKEDAAKEPPAPPKLATPPPVPQPEVSAAQNAFSTFSLNVSDVSFKLAAASLEKGVLPEAASIRTEEFINAFDYHDPEPTGGAPIGFAWERARYPFAHDRDLVRCSVKTSASGRVNGRPLNLVLLIDNSGSMERADRVAIREQCLRVLASQLQAQDRISVVSFARTPRLWVDGQPGNQAGDLSKRIGSLTPEGGTNLEEAMNVAYQTALRHFLPNGINRVVLLTDGAANLGDVEPESLKKKVESNRKQGVAIDCFGIGWEGYNDDLLEALSRNGDGRYGFVNTPAAAATDFAGQLAGALKVAASDVKVQVEWNPRRVTTWRQIGYAKHQLKKEQFRDNTVDAAEIAAAEAGNALYTVQVNPAGEGPLGTVRVRFRIPNTNDYREHEWPLAYTGPAKALDESSNALRLAATGSAFSEMLASSPFAGEVTPERLLGQIAGVAEQYPADPRPKQLEWMIRQARSLGVR